VTFQGTSLAGSKQGHDGFKPVYQKKLYLKLSLAALISSASYGLFYVLMSVYPLVYLAIVLFIAFYLLRISMNFRLGELWTFRLSVLLTFFGFFYQVVYTGGIHSAMVPHLLLGPALSFFYYERKDRYVFVSLSVISIIGFGLMYYTGYSYINLIPVEYRPVFDMFNHLYIFSVSLYFMFLFRYFVKKSNQKLRQSIQDVKLTTQKLIESEKFAALGQLTAGIAHEINNPVNFLQGSSNELLKLKDEILMLEQLRTKCEIGISSNPSVSDEVKDSLSSIRRYKEKIKYDVLKEEFEQLVYTVNEGARRTAEIVKSLNIYSRNQSVEFLPFDILRSLDVTLTLLNNKLEDRIVVEKKYGEMPIVYGNEGKIAQVFMNLLSNAIQAIEGDGKIGVATEIEESDRVHVQISDSGKGIPEKDQPFIFDPFFTTKEVGKGTGLGLSISKGIIEEHGGTLNFETSQSGTIFHVYLPIYNADKSNSDHGKRPVGVPQRPMKG